MTKDDNSSSGSQAELLAPQQRQRRLTVTRNWMRYAGQSRWLCDGRLLRGPEQLTLAHSIAMIVVPSLLFAGFSIKFLTNNVSLAVPFAFVFLLFQSLVNLFRAASTDPGFLPRSQVDESQCSAWSNVADVRALADGVALGSQPRTRETTLHSGQKANLKYCYTCKIWRPPRTSHCSECDACCTVFDHHCPWIGNCVGERNYRFFYLFVTSTTVLALFLFSLSITHLVLLSHQNSANGQSSPFVAALRHAWGAAIVALFTFMAIWSVLGLSCFHTYLACSSLTTNEEIKMGHAQPARHRRAGIPPPPPHSHVYGNFITNFTIIIFGPRRESFLNARGYPEDDPLFAVAVPMPSMAGAPTLLATTHTTPTPSTNDPATSNALLPAPPGPQPPPQSSAQAQLQRSLAHAQQMQQQHPVTTVGARNQVDDSLE